MLLVHCCIVSHLNCFVIQLFYIYIYLYYIIVLPSMQSMLYQYYIPVNNLHVVIVYSLIDYAPTLHPVIIYDNLLKNIYWSCHIFIRYIYIILVRLWRDFLKYIVQKIYIEWVVQIILHCFNLQITYKIM